jgi:hypothetical protein
MLSILIIFLFQISLGKDKLYIFGNTWSCLTCGDDKVIIFVKNEKYMSKLKQKYDITLFLKSNRKIEYENFIRKYEFKVNTKRDTSNLFDKYMLVFPSFYVIVNENDSIISYTL